eukprot:3300153-Pyramimonas_sp.AAC.1
MPVVTSIRQRRVSEAYARPRAPRPPDAARGFGTMLDICVWGRCGRTRQGCDGLSRADCAPSTCGYLDYWGVARCVARLFGFCCCEQRVALPGSNGTLKLVQSSQCTLHYTAHGIGCYADVTCMDMFELLHVLSELDNAPIGR